jgi:hypothetical protein
MTIVLEFCKHTPVHSRCTVLNICETCECVVHVCVCVCVVCVYIYSVYVFCIYAWCLRLCMHMHHCAQQRRG